MLHAVDAPLHFLLSLSPPAPPLAGAVLTAEAGGNVALAVLLSVVTNVVGVFTVPFFLSLFLTTGDQAADEGEVRARAGVGA